MHGIQARIATILLLVAALVPAGCGGGYEILRERPLAEDVRVPEGVVVFPVAMMTHKADALEVAIRSSEVAAWLLDHTDAPVIGPLDFRIFKPIDEIRVASTDTDLATRSDGERVSLAGWWSIAVLVTENRSASVQNVVDTRKGKDGTTVKQAFGVESVLQVEVTIADALRGGVIATAQVSGVDRHNDAASEGDPRPRVGQLIRAAMRIALGDARERLAAGGKRRFRGREGLTSVTALTSSAFPDRPSYEEPLKNKDAFTRESAIMTVWYRLDPKLPMRPALASMNNPGVMMRASRAPLQQYDIITRVEGVPVIERYQVDRALRNCVAVGCKVEVLRAGKSIHETLRWTEPPASPEGED
ncbi:MAG: hypothetical protein RIT45_2059 [Pseudomonadota bacterium]|jgi:hypothetical protein